MRTDGSKGTYEWWYFDSTYPDGTKLVLQYYSKSPIQVDGPHQSAVWELMYFGKAGADQAYRERTNEV